MASDLQDQGLQAYVEIDRDTAGRLGVTPAAIDNALYNAFGQRLVSTIFTQSNQYRVVLEVKPEFGHGPAALQDLYVPSSNATLSSGNTAQVPLASLAKVIEQPAPLAINHIGQFPAATISFNLAPRRVARRGGRRDRGRAAASSACRRACAPASRARRSRSAPRSRTRCC